MLAGGRGSRLRNWGPENWPGCIFESKGWSLKEKLSSLLRNPTGLMDTRSVRDRANFFEARKVDHQALGRSQSQALPLRHDATIPQPMQSATTSVISPNRQKSGQSSIEQEKPPPLPKRRPPVPVKSKSTAGILRSQSVIDEPYRITLIDLEENEPEPGDFSLVEHPRDVTRVAEEDVDVSTPDRGELSSLEKAKQRTVLLSQSVLKDVRSLTEDGFLRTKTTAENVARSVSPLTDKVNEGFNKVKSETSNALVKSGAAKVADQSKDNFKNVFDSSKTSSQAMLRMSGATRYKDDVIDIARNLYSTNDGVCSKCSTLPLEACVPGANEVVETELYWATPLARIIYHSNWCRMCRLFLSMLCRKEHDPLQHPEVKPFVPDELRGVSMQQWVAQGWSYTDEHWPFGHSEQRNEGATYVLGAIGDASKKVATRYGRIAIKSVIAAMGNRRYVYSRDRSEAYRRGLEKGREENVKYPLSCVLQVSLRTCEDLETPGLVFASLIGYGNRPGGSPQCLSKFRLRAVQLGLPTTRGPGSDLSYGQLLDKSWIDVSIAQLWLSECEKNHGSSCREHGWAVAMDKPAFLRVIDTESSCIVEAPDPKSCRYVALSYVWGGPQKFMLMYANMAALTKEGGLLQYLDDMPRTVVDAMEVVRRMGERYLWVDSLCIIQETPKTKEALEQIATMDRVYGNALATIVAADGTHASAGLPGVRREYICQDRSSEDNPRTVSQPSTEFKPGLEVILPFQGPQTLSASAWNSRAWTFQEKLLSRRLIVFSGNEMIWHCRSKIYREDMPVEDSACQQPPLDWLVIKPQYLGVDIDPYRMDDSKVVGSDGATRLVRLGPFKEYTKMIEQYTHRTLTYSSDALNALAGLQNIFQLCFRSEFTAGLPRILLDPALFWHPTEQLSRRAPCKDGTEFPSWSWAGWTGKVAYCKAKVITRDDTGRITGVREDDLGEEGIRPLLRWFFFDVTTSLFEPLNGTGRGIPLDERTPPREWENEPYTARQRYPQIYQTPKPSDLDPVTRLNIRNNHHLVFWTSCTRSLRFGNAATQPSDRKWNTERPPLRFSLTDKNFEWVGTLLLDGDGPDWLDNERHELIQISEAQYFGLDGERQDLGEYQLYLIMLTERDPATNIVRRLGLGRVYKYAWELAQPEIKLICLG